MPPLPCGRHFHELMAMAIQEYDFLLVAQTPIEENAWVPQSDRADRPSFRAERSMEDDLPERHLNMSESALMTVIDEPSDTPMPARRTELGLEPQTLVYRGKDRAACWQRFALHISGERMHYVLHPCWETAKWQATLTRSSRPLENDPSRACHRRRHALGRGGNLPTTTCRCSLPPRAVRRRRRIVLVWYTVTLCGE